MSKSKTTKSTNSEEMLKEKAATTHKLTLRMRMKWPFLVTVGCVLVFLGSATAYAFVYDDRIAPHTWIAGVKVGGMTKDQATQALRAHSEAFAKRELVMSYEEKRWTVTPSQLGSSFATDEVVAETWSADTATSWKHQIARLAASLVQTRHLDVGFVSLSDSGREFLTEQVLKTIETPYQETSLAFTPGNVTIIEGKSGQKLNEEALDTGLYHAFKKGDTTIALSLSEFSPELTAAQAESARQQAQAILSGAWSLKVPSGVAAISVEPKTIATLLKSEVDRDGAGKATQLVLGVKSDVLNELMKSWGDQVRQAPVNAKVAWDGTKVSVVAEGVDGRDLNTEKTAAAITKQLTTATAETPRQLATVIDVTRPEVRSDTLEALGIKELIGTNTTDYTGSPTNRKFNIARGQRSLDKLLVKPGEIFSTTTALGPVEESTGYLAELVIKGNRTIPEAGGGLCQVSTTLFRAVLNAGLQITERQNHAYRVSYYERETGPGLDATVYIPNPDLKWKNDMTTAVYIQSFVTKDNKVTFELFGTKDGRVSVISAPEILETYYVGQPIYSNTDTLYVGETKQIEKAHDGAKTRVNYTVTRDGKEIYKKTFISVYKAWPAQYLVGTKVRTDAPPPAEATPTPDPTATPSP